MHKIATCCYCGTRAALVLRGEGRHELSCTACGAPLHAMKAIPQQRIDSAARTSFAGQGMHRRSPVQPNRTKAKLAGPSAKPQIRHRAPDYDDDDDDARRRPRRRKPLFRNALEEIWDVVEDIFD